MSLKFPHGAAGSNLTGGSHFGLLCRILFYHFFLKSALKVIYYLKFLALDKNFFLEFRPTYCDQLCCWFLAAASAAGSAIYKVMFKRIFGDVSFCQVSLFFTMIGLCSLILLWPIFLALYLSGMGKKGFCLLYKRNCEKHVWLKWQLRVSQKTKSQKFKKLPPWDFLMWLNGFQKVQKFENLPKHAKGFPNSHLCVRSNFT